MKKKIGVGILGGTGYGAGELMRLLACHPYVDVVWVTSSSSPGKRVCEMHSQLMGFLDELFFSAGPNLQAFAGFDYGVVFSSLPHGVSANEISALLREPPENLRVIDLSGDFRLQDPVSHERFYPEAKTDPALRREFVYGLTELFAKEIASSRCISNPGCYATTCILSVVPLVRAGLLKSVSFDAKSGTSGAGRNPTQQTHHPEQNANLLAYKVLAHRHEPEIAEVLCRISPVVVETAFVPHLLPISRGIFVTAHATLEEERPAKEISGLYDDFFSGSRFVRIRRGSPELTDVVGSNFCDVSIAQRGRQIVAMAALDNLVKGMAGQAIQNMNLMCGLPEDTGLWQPSLGLV